MFFKRPRILFRLFSISYRKQSKYFYTNRAYHAVRAPETCWVFFENFQFSIIWRLGWIGRRLVWDVLLQVSWQRGLCIIRYTATTFSCWIIRRRRVFQLFEFNFLKRRLLCWLLRFNSGTASLIRICLKTRPLGVCIWIYGLKLFQSFFQTTCLTEKFQIFLQLQRASTQTHWQSECNS